VERAHLIWLPAGLALQAMAVYVTGAAASTDLRFGIRADSGNIPGAVLLDAGTIAADVTGVRSLPITFTVPNTPVGPVGGVPLWLTVTPQGAGTVTMLATQPLSEMRDATTANAALFYHGCVGQSGVTGALPGTFAVTISNAPAPTFAVQAA